MNAAKVKSIKDRVDALPTTKWAAITALVTFLGTGAGMKVMDRFWPDTRAAMEQMAKDQALMREDLESIKRAYWKQYGIKVQEAQDEH